MKPFIMAVLLLAMASVPTVLRASEDWGSHCYQVAPFADVIIMRLVRPNPPEWSLVAQAELVGLTAYVLPGGGDFHASLEATIESPDIYLVNLTFYNTSTFFSGHPIVTLRGVVWGPFSVEARGKAGVNTFVTQGTLMPVVCSDEVVTQSSELLYAQHGIKALMGAQ